MTNHPPNTIPGHGAAVAEQTPDCCPAPKWAAVIGDTLFPMPRQKLTARDILDQAGLGRDVVLQRDHGSPNDVVLADDAEVNLGEGNVFRAIPRCEAGLLPHCVAAPKLAFVLDDDWKVTLTSDQTGHTLKRLFGLPDNTELLRDYASPNDVLIGNDEWVRFSDGCVFTARKLTVTIKVNNQPVRFTKRRVTALELKKTAIAQGVKVDEGCVLYAIKPDGSLSPAIGDDVTLTLKDCDEFRCVPPDDNS